MSKEKVIDIRSVQVLKKTGLKIGYIISEDIEGGEVNKVYMVENDAEPVQTLQTSLRLLIPHLLNICEISPVVIDAKYIKSRNAVNDPALDKFRVTKVELDGEDEDVVAVLHGKKFLKNGVFEFKTPKVKLLGAECTYDFSGNLYESINDLLEEAEAYLGGKFTPAAQLEIQY